MDETWTLPQLVERAAARIAALPPPKNGQIRAVPDDRTIRYYVALGLVDRPLAMRGRTGLYGARHLAQVVAIKRLQGAGKSLAVIRQMWPTLEDHTLARLTGVQVASKGRAGRAAFWKREAAAVAATAPDPARAPALAPVAQGSAPPPAASGVALASVTSATAPDSASAPAPVELRVELAAQLALVVAIPDDAPFSLTPADIRALRTAAAPLVAELARHGLTARSSGTLEEP